MVVSLAPRPVPPNEVSLNTRTAPTYSDSNLDPMVERSAYAFQTAEQEVREQFLAGNEYRFREQVYAQAAYEDRKKRIDLAQQFSWAAAKDGRPMTKEERDYILKASQEQFDANPETIIEKLYTRRLVEDILRDEVDSAGLGGVAIEAEETEQVKEVVSAMDNFLTKQQVAQTILSEVQAKFDNQNLLDKGLNIGAGFIPFYTWFQQRDRVDQNGNLLLGSNIEAQMRTLYLSPNIQEFEARLRTAIDEIGKGNLWEAMTFASAAVAYSGSNALWDNIFTGLDAIDVGGAVGSTAIAARLARRTKSVAAAGSVPGSSGTAARQVMSGNIAAASQTKATQKIVAATSQSPTSYQNLRDLMNSQYGFMDTQSYMRNAGSLANERAARLEEILLRQQESLNSVVTEIPHIVRQGAQAAQEGFKRAEVEFRQNYRSLEDAIVEVRHVRESEQAYAGVDHIEILLGTKDAQGFKTAEKAENFAKKYRLVDGSYTVKDVDGNFFIRMTKTIDETDLRSQNLRITTNNKTPQSLAHTILSGIRSNQHLVSKEHANWRLVATFGGNAVMDRLGNVAKTIGNLGKNEYERIRGMMDHERFLVNGGNAPIRTVGDFETEFSRKYQAMPTDNEIAAWFTYRQLLDFDHMIQNISVYRDKARLGVEQKSVGFSKAIDPEAKKPRYSYVNSEFFEARTVQGLPTTQEPYTIAWIDPETGRWKFEVSNRIGVDKAKSWNDMKARLDDGEYTVLQMMDPRNRQIGDMVDAKGEPVMYVAVRAGHVKTKPLSMEQVPYDPKLAYHDNTGFFVKQVKSHNTGRGRVVIDGETSVLRTSTNAEGTEAVADWERARLLVRRMRDGDASARTELATLLNRLPVNTVDELDAMFKTPGKIDDEGVFSLNNPFVLTASGQRIKNIRTYDDFIDKEIVDLDESSHSMKNQMATRVAAHDIYGTQQRPIFDVGGANVVDPMESLGRAGKRIAQSRFYDDYIHQSVENWATEFADQLSVSRQVLMRNPMKYLTEPVWNDSTDFGKRTAAKSARRAILDLLGRDTKDATAIKYATQKIADSIYRAHGKKANKLLDMWALNKQSDPTAVMRSLVFHPKLGMFNPLQFFLQGSASLYVGAIDGNVMRAVQGQYAYWAMRSRNLMANAPQAQKAFGGKVAKALGIRQQDLDEMYELWNNSGISMIKGEVTTVEDYLNPKMFFGRGPGKTAADASLFFFREGNGWHRGTAFSTAYLRWRQENPNKILDINDIRQITERTDLMYLNMTRAGNAWWQRGVMSVPSQFFSFHARLMEELLGTRLTNGEKLRVFGVMSAVWGVPIGAGQFVGAVWPVNDAFQQWSLENGIDLDANVMTKVLSDGLGDMLVEALTGTNFNVSERYGPNGLSWVRDILDGNAWEVFSGASGSFIGEVLETMDPFTHAAVSVFNDDSSRYNITQDDVVSVLRSISTINNAVKAYQVWNLGQWKTRNDRLQMETGSGDFMAAAAAAMGLTPDEVGEAYLKIRSNKQFDQARRAVEAQAREEFERGLKYAADGDYEMMELYFKRAHIVMQSGEFTPLQRGEAFSRSVEPNLPLVEQVGTEFVMRDPEKRLPTYLTEETGG